MRKKIILLLICLNLVQAKVQNVELLADSVTRVGEIVNANGNVVAYSQDYFLTADRAVYDKKNEILELFGNKNANYAHGLFKTLLSDRWERINRHIFDGSRGRNLEPKQ